MSVISYFQVPLSRYLIHDPLPKRSSDHIQDHRRHPENPDTLSEKPESRRNTSLVAASHNHQCIKVPLPTSPEQFNTWIEDRSSSSEPHYACAWPGCVTRPEYPTPARVRTHMYAEHRNQSPFVCILPTCGKVFARARDAQLHCTMRQALITARSPAPPQVA